MPTMQVHEVPAITNSGSYLSFLAQGIDRVTSFHRTFLMDMLHILCPDQRCRRTSSPQPKAAFPDAYTGYEHGILITIYPPYPAMYEMSGQDIWYG
ncbi:lytic polysaccharide monooxygenase [Sphaerobolus stellatus SS14]|uniref:Lytic polysaccharide monooxygenase n=1 Tax=Sphaerobolus stellatus (strain SS14) TaxID=990650 RepID=A0A0C9UZX6_SPHS4|nr:lytic polysaccharide monooxygenase [Sphaerobolus stellatus SS14]